MNEKNIYQRMAAITAELATVAKNLTVETGGGKGYKAVSERDIIDAVKPLEEKHGVYSYPLSREVLESQLLESESTYNGKTTKKTTFFSRIKTVYAFVNVDKPEECITTTVFSEGIDSQDKGSGKAMTYGDKYALMKAYKISTGDDPDQTASEDTEYSQPRATVTAEEADSIIRGLAFCAGDKTEAQRELLFELCGYEDVYKLPRKVGVKVYDKLVERGKAIKCGDAS